MPDHPYLPDGFPKLLPFFPPLPDKAMDFGRRNLKTLRVGARIAGAPGLIAVHPDRAEGQPLEGDKDVIGRYLKEKEDDKKREAKKRKDKHRLPRSINTTWGAELPVTGWRDYSKKTFEE